MTKARSYSQITKAVYQRPWAIQPAMLAVIEEIVRLRVTGTPLSEEQVDARVTAAQNGERLGAQQAQGVAVIPVYGVISQRMNLMTAMSGGTTVEGLTRAFRGALADPEIGAIVFDVDSPGGSVEGLTELANEIRSARGQKPMVAVANPVMASAAYWLASQLDEVVASPSAQVGSIGIIGHHLETSKADEMAGETFTLITAGEGKELNSSHVPITDDGRAELQQLADDFYSLFVADVAAARDVEKRVVTGEWKAQVYTAKRAKAAGLVDRLDTLDATVRRLVGKLNRSPLRAIGSWGGSVEASAIGRHKTATDDAAWDGPANERRCPAERGPLRASHAWVDDDADPDTKDAYKFIHHFVTEDGSVGAASTRGCSNGIAVLNGGRGGTDIPAGDRAGVHAHLAGHLRDAGQEAPPLKSEAPQQTIAAAMASMPIHEQAALWTSERDRILAHYAERERLRAKEGRPLSAQAQQHAAALAAELELPSEPDDDADLDTDEPEEADSPQAPQALAHDPIEILEAATRGGYRLPAREVPIA